MRVQIAAAALAACVMSAALPAQTPATPAPTPAPQTPQAPATPPAADDDDAPRPARTPPPPPPPLPAVMPAPVAPIVSATAPTPDPRVGLAPGYWDAAQAAWNMRLVSNTPPSEKFVGVTNSDLAFTGNYVVQGNYNGFQVFDMSNPAAPKMVLAYLCPASQSDVSVYKNLLFVSGEGQTGRLDCGIQGVPEPVSKDRLRGIRIFDITDITKPKYVSNVQTCRGSHTHTVVSDPSDPAHVYIYISGSSRVRPAEELPGCQDGPIEDPNSARFRLEVIRVPIAEPEKAAIVTSPRVFNDLAPPPRRVEAPEPGRAPRPARTPSGPNQCHDITTYPELGLAGGACGGYGLLLDIREVAHPIRIDAAADINMSFWHSATFSNDGTKILFSDEWGGGTQPRCRDTDKYEWGANALFALENGKMTFKSYYKMPAVQTSTENCVAHNGSLIPIPGRDVMVQGWYQGGISVFDWTDVSNPKEIAYFDRGPVNAERLISGGSWSVYWYNGLIVSSEIARGLDVFELVASGLVTQNELDAAKTVEFKQLNAQEQQKMVWPPSFALARAYVDQIERANGLTPARIAALRTDLKAAESATGTARRNALAKIASVLKGEAASSGDAAKVGMLATTVTELR
jgi:hypothetical protein